MTARLFIVDVEATGPTPYSGVMTEFGVVDFTTRDWFYGHLFHADPHPDNPALPVLEPGTEPTPWMLTNGGQQTRLVAPVDVFQALGAWLARTAPGRRVFVSDNPGFDFMWMADGFDRAGMRNPFGHSSRRIGDLAAGLSGKWRDTSSWKRHRVTGHDHHPVNDALGNAEALHTILTRHGQLPG